MGEVAHHVEPADAFALQHLDGVGVGLVEQGHQDVRPLDLVLRAAAHAGRGEGEHALHAEGEARLEVLVVDLLQLLGEVLGEVFPHAVEVRPGVLEHAGRLVVEGQGVEQVLQARVFMTQPPGLGDGDGKGDLQIVGELHSSSSLSSSGSTESLRGMPFSRASSMTSATLVSATSLE